VKTVVVPPSSGLSGHLLPAGEKREVAAIPNSTASEEATGSLFSPAGRRGPEGSDEGAGATQKARTLRHNQTEAEYRLWGDIRNRLLNGYKFSRQVPLGPYAADFVCRERMLIMELDGSQHADSQQDRTRTRWLNENGYSVLRFWNHEVLQERRAVLATFLAVLNAEITSQGDFIRFSPSLIGKTIMNTE
jgi:very-short-patch-repair endonuclease